MVYWLQKTCVRWQNKNQTKWGNDKKKLWNNPTLHSYCIAQTDKRFDCLLTIGRKRLRSIPSLCRYTANRSDPANWLWTLWWNFRLLSVRRSESRAAGRLAWRRFFVGTVDSRRGSTAHWSWDRSFWRITRYNFFSLFGHQNTPKMFASEFSKCLRFD
jgi:hypothetical protein